MTSSVWLHSDRLSVEVRPGKGADITSVTERTSGIDVLWRTPWGRRDLAGAPVTGDSQTDWLARYGGGWQQLVPNAGAERTVDGVRRRYHGEAAVVAWTVESADEAEVRPATSLITAPPRSASPEACAWTGRSCTSATPSTTPPGNRYR